MIWSVDAQVFGTLGFVWLALWIPNGLPRDFPPAPAAEAEQPLATVAAPPANSAEIVEISEGVGAVACAEEIGCASDGSSANLAEPISEVPWAGFGRSKAVWGMTAAHAASCWGSYVTAAWLPTYLSEAWSLSLSDSALLSVLPYVGGVVGANTAGWAADALVGRDVDLTTVRKGSQAVASFGPALCFACLAAGPSSTTAALAAFSCAVASSSASAAGFQVTRTSYTSEDGGRRRAAISDATFPIRQALTQDLSSRYSGILYGVTTTAAALFGSFGVYLAGLILERELGCAPRGRMHTPEVAS